MDYLIEKAKRQAERLCDSLGKTSVYQWADITEHQLRLALKGSQRLQLRTMEAIEKLASETRGFNPRALLKHLSESHTPTEMCRMLKMCSSNYDYWLKKDFNIQLESYTVLKLYSIFQGE